MANAPFCLPLSDHSKHSVCRSATIVNKSESVPNILPIIRITNIRNQWNASEVSLLL